MEENLLKLFVAVVMPLPPLEQRWRSGSSHDHMWSNKHFGRHFLTYLWNCITLY